MAKRDCAELLQGSELTFDQARARLPTFWDDLLVVRPIKHGDLLVNSVNLEGAATLRRTGMCYAIEELSNAWMSFPDYFKPRRLLLLDFFETYAKSPAWNDPPEVSSKTVFWLDGSKYMARCLGNNYQGRYQIFVNSKPALSYEFRKYINEQGQQCDFFDLERAFLTEEEMKRLVLLSVLAKEEFTRRHLDSLGAPRG